MECMWICSLTFKVSVRVHTEGVESTSAEVVEDVEGL